jgi:uncharacterized membrane protein YfcA
LAIFFTLNFYFKIYNPSKSPKKNSFSGYFWGAVAAFTSFTAHAGGPPLNMYLLPLRLNKLTYVATIAAFIALTNVVKVFPYIYMGLFSYESLTVSALLIPVAAVGAKIGFWLQKTLDERIFYHFCYGFLFLAGVKLIYSALA